MFKFLSELGFLQSEDEQPSVGFTPANFESLLNTIVSSLNDAFIEHLDPSLLKEQHIFSNVSKLIDILIEEDRIHKHSQEPPTFLSITIPILPRLISLSYESVETSIASGQLISHLCLKILSSVISLSYPILNHHTLVSAINGILSQFASPLFAGVYPHLPLSHLISSIVRYLVEKGPCDGLIVRDVDGCVVDFPLGRLAIVQVKKNLEEHDIISLCNLLLWIQTFWREFLQDFFLDVGDLFDHLFDGFVKSLVKIAMNEAENHENFKIFEQYLKFLVEFSSVDVVGFTKSFMELMIESEALDSLLHKECFLSPNTTIMTALTMTLNHLQSKTCLLPLYLSFCQRARISVLNSFGDCSILSNENFCLKFSLLFSASLPFIFWSVNDQPLLESKLEYELANIKDTRLFFKLMFTLNSACHPARSDPLPPNFEYFEKISARKINKSTTKLVLLEKVLSHDSNHLGSQFVNLIQSLFSYCSENWFNSSILTLPSLICLSFLIVEIFQTFSFSSISHTLLLDTRKSSLSLYNRLRQVSESGIGFLTSKYSSIEELLSVLQDLRLRMIRGVIHDIVPKPNEEETTMYLVRWIIFEQLCLELEAVCSVIS
ncbi:hypothetical protein P9112_004036 [Eukaryota sp. TZLM1-RC]